MKKTASGILLLVALAFAPTAQAAGGPFGLGVILGEPTGFTARYFTSAKNSFDGGLAWSFSDFFLVYADYQWVFPGAFVQGDSPGFVRQLDPYVGVGLVLLISTNSGRRDGKLFTSTGNSAGVGIRIPLGMEWRPSDPPLGVFLEIVPGIGFIPSTFAFFEGGIGVRYYL